MGLGICKHVLEGMPLAINKRATSGKSIKTGEASKKRRASEGMSSLHDNLENI